MPNRGAKLAVRGEGWYAYGNYVLPEVKVHKMTAAKRIASNRLMQNAMFKLE